MAARNKRGNKTKRAENIGVWTMVRDVLIAAIQRGQLPQATMALFCIVAVIRMPGSDVSKLLFSIMDRFADWSILVERFQINAAMMPRVIQKPKVCLPLLFGFQAGVPASLAPYLFGTLIWNRSTRVVSGSRHHDGLGLACETTAELVVIGDERLSRERTEWQEQAMNQKLGSSKR